MKINRNGFSIVHFTNCITNGIKFLNFQFMIVFNYFMSWPDPWNNVQYCAAVGEKYINKQYIYVACGWICDTSSNRSDMFSANTLFICTQCIVEKGSFSIYFVVVIVAISGMPIYKTYAMELENASQKIVTWGKQNVWLLFCWN